MRSVVDRNVVMRRMTVLKDAALKERKYFSGKIIYEGWNFNSGNYLFTTDTK